VVKDAVVTNAVTAASLLQQVGRVGHALHAPGHQHLVRARQQHVMREHGCAHARAAHLAQRDRARAFGQAAFEGSLSRGGLALAGHQAIAKQDFAHQGRIDARTLHGCGNGHPAEVVRGQRSEISLKTPHRCPSGAHNDDWILHKYSQKKKVVRQAPRG